MSDEKNDFGGSFELFCILESRDVTWKRFIARAINNKHLILWSFSFDANFSFKASYRSFKYCRRHFNRVVVGDKFWFFEECFPFWLVHIVNNSYK